ncbi:unnamed protein product [Gongylonema pulchrum]|uniref:Ig-like domain-containing protein n=1 Tax=Gongylonema pulchrum TaxID=637853 RepID=A0A183DMI2_9BILA|nr:unnamed protein product [Gongylonema pulchrum]
MANHHQLSSGGGRIDKSSDSMAPLDMEGFQFSASVFNGSELTITKVSRKHMSEYVCVASNGIPPDESWSVKLHVTCMFTDIAH